jgi:hypothetical protein
MKAMSRTVLLLSAAALLPLPARAQNLRYDRGTILNMDWNTFQVEIKDAKDRERIWPVAKDATVKFSDKAWGNRGSTLKDLRRNMYVHFSYSGEPEVIQGFDVKDAGQAQQDPPTNRPAPGGPGVSGRVTAVDLNVAQVEIQPSGGARKAYQAANAQVLAGLRAGDQVFLVIENRNGQEVVVQVRRGR